MAILSEVEELDDRSSSSSARSSSSLSALADGYGEGDTSGSSLVVVVGGSFVISIVR